MIRLPFMQSDRRWLVPEVVQTSSMDCGPAALKCILEGFGIPVSYGRLREACQTDVDGTSIDTLEGVTVQLGLAASQEMLPLDHVLANPDSALPAIAVVRHSEGPTHFVVIWRKIGPWLQLMDPSVGRRWTRVERFLEEIYRHETSIAASDWREWVSDVTHVIRERLKGLGVDPILADAFIAEAAADPFWFSFGALDASIRLCQSIISSGGIRKGSEAGQLVHALFKGTRSSTGDIFRLVPQTYWSVIPDPAAYDAGNVRLLYRGAVLLRVQRVMASTGINLTEDTRPLSPELAAALAEPAQSPLRLLWHTFRSDGLTGPAVLLGAMAIATAATAIEAVLFRALFDVGAFLNLPEQRVLGLLALLAFAVILLALRIPVVAEGLRMGRVLDLRLRMALLQKLPQLSDRYFQSRPLSDMADRSHSIHLAKVVPQIGIQFMQTLFELVLVFGGVIYLDPQAIVPAIVLVLLAILIPLLVQPLVNERDLRVRSHSAALSGFYLDTLLGLVPVRTHRAQRSIRHQHETLLVEWARSSRRLIRAMILAGGVQLFACVGAGSYLLVSHFSRVGRVTGADLLLIFWALKLPAIASALSALAQQYPMQRNILMRLLEPLSAPDESPYRTTGAEPRAAATTRHGAGADIQINAGKVIVAGSVVLRDVDLAIGAGEHVAIVGMSGAGKSTLVGLLLGWNRLAEGTLRVDGDDVTTERLRTLRRETAWLDPGVQIWNASLLDNLVYSSQGEIGGRPAEAATRARLRNVLQKLPEGLQTRLGEGGGLLSGGEGQRVRFGRSLVQSPVRLALLDEPFRGIDRNQRVAMLAEARAHWKDATLLCVTHDVHETMAFQRVVVIADGRIVEDGAPAELAARDSHYRTMLQTEQDLRSRMWVGAQWRRWSLQAGKILEGDPR